MILNFFTQTKRYFIVLSCLNKQLFTSVRSSLVFTLFLVCSTITLLPAGPVKFVAPEPEDLIIYHLFLDRFNDGDEQNNNANPRGNFDPTAGFGWHGGDLKGATDKLDYIANLGVNGIWLSPFVEGVRDYHGYAAFDFYKVDPNFGTLEDLRTFIDEANARGIAVYFDMVAGHMGTLLTSNSFGYPSYLAPPQEYTMRWNSSLRYPPPFNDLNLFHAHGHIGNYFGEEQEKGELADLDDLKTETPEVQDLMTDIWRYWLTETNVSGFRIDTVKHVDLEFWRVFLPRLQLTAEELGRDNYYTFGEIYGADDNFMSEYIGTLRGEPYKLDSAVDFQFYYASQGVFVRANRPPSDLSFRLQAREQSLGEHHLKMPNFLDNHDVPRFLHVSQENPGSGLGEQQRRLDLGLIGMFMLPGPPIVYNGTEQGFNGGNDPQNREDMFDGEYEFGPSIGDNFVESSRFYQLIARLSLLRKELPALRRGNYKPLVVNQSGPGLWAFTRSYEGSDVLVVLNTSTNASGSLSVTIPGFANSSITDALNPANTRLLDATGTIQFTSIPAQGASIWIPSAQVPALPLGVATINPPDGEVGVSLQLDQVTVTFTEAMNEAATENAFTMEPVVPFDVTWDVDSITATLNLTGMLQPETEYTLTVLPSAESLEGSQLGRNVTSTWKMERLPRALPPLPEIAGILRPMIGTITLDGDAEDWPDTSVLPRNQHYFAPGNFYIWNDAIDDDNGPGSYVYPTNEVFTDGDADIRRLGIAYDAENMYFLIEQESINPFASFYTAYFGIGIDLGIQGRTKLGYDQATGELGITDTFVRGDADVDRELIFTGPRGVTLLNETGTPIEGAVVAFSAETGTIEIAVPRGLLGLDSPLMGRTIALYAYSALETFGGIREVGINAGNYEPGGGIASPTDPDIFDLVGASVEDQQFDLIDFTEDFETTIGASLILITLVDFDSEPTLDQWIFQ